MSDKQEILEWLERYGGYDAALTEEGLRAIKADYKPDVIDMVAGLDYDLVDYLERKIANQHSRVLKAIRRSRNTAYYGHYCGYRSNASEGEFLAYLSDYYDLRRLKLARINRSIPNYTRQNSAISGRSAFVNNSLDSQLARSETATAHEREQRYHERERQVWQRKKEISSQFKSAVESGHIPPPQAGSDTKRRSKLDQLQQAGLSERYDSRGGSSSSSSNKRLST